ncbi:MAG: sensor protein [Geminicoccaceae bacterium]|nr:sensor protein [Geminicoccaceae bacterium]
MTPENFRTVTDVLPEAYLLVSGVGNVLTANRAAVSLFGLPVHTPAAAGPPIPLASLVRDPVDQILTYVRACSRSRSLLPGALTLSNSSDAATTTVRHRCEGAVLDPRTPDSPSAILLRIRREDTAAGRFAGLTKQLAEMTREVRLRRQVERERAALLAETIRTREELEQQTVELEAQREEAQSLAEELEQANEELSAALEDAERARDAADRANRAKADFLTMMSHELRTPLNAIAGYAQLLSLGLRGPLNEEQLADVARIDRSQRHLLSLINDVLNFAKVDAGRVSFDVREVSANELLNGLAPLFEPQLRARELRLALVPCTESLVLKADAERTHQILANLISNAVKFTPPGGEIMVACEDGDWHVVFRVRDSGIGIPADKLEAIFEPFVQLHRSLAQPTEGTGLGLAISRDLARSMGGDLTAESIEGQGAVFTLTLPRGAASSA